MLFVLSLRFIISVIILMNTDKTVLLYATSTSVSVWCWSFIMYALRARVCVFVMSFFVWWIMIISLFNFPSARDQALLFLFSFSKNCSSGNFNVTIFNLCDEYFVLVFLLLWHKLSRHLKQSLYAKPSLVLQITDTCSTLFIILHYVAHEPSSLLLLFAHWISANIIIFLSVQVRYQSWLISTPPFNEIALKIFCT